MPDVAQQTETIRDSAQPDRNEPRGDDQQRDRRDVDAEQVDLEERQAPSPASKYAPCWTTPSRACVAQGRPAGPTPQARQDGGRGRQTVRLRRRYALAPRPRAPRRAPRPGRVEVQSAAD